MKDILLVTINAKWIHPSLALRLLKANLGPLEDRCGILEFALRQPLAEKLDPFITACPRILGVSVSIWNHGATAELLGELERIWTAVTPAGLRNGEGFPPAKPVVVLGGPEVSHLPPEAEIFRFADYVIRGEGEIEFRTLCERIMGGMLLRQKPLSPQKKLPPSQFISSGPVNPGEIKSGYHLYTDEDLAKKLIYVEASRGCPFNCEFCLSAVKPSSVNAVREFPLESFLAEMEELIRRGAKTFKFLDRTFNLDIRRALRIMEFFLDKIERRRAPLMVHFEMIPSHFPSELREILARFPPNTLRLEIGIQTLNPEAAARIGRPSDPEKEMETLRFLHEKTSAIIHADLIAGLPGEDLDSFGRGFDRLWAAFSTERNEPDKMNTPGAHPRTEIQLGILKFLPGAPIFRHAEAFGMRYNPRPPYEVMETSSLSVSELDRIKNFARFWELIVNRGLADYRENSPVFDDFMALSDSLLDRFGRNWGIDKNELLEEVAGSLNLL